MILENYFWVAEGVLPKRICDDLVSYGESQVQQLGYTGDFEANNLDENDLSKLYKTRNSNIIWMNEPWITNAILPIVDEANKAANWNFSLEEHESCQWTKYGPEQHYTWHADAFPKPWSDPKSNLYGLTRKLSVTVSLIEGNTYEGGDLEFEINNKIYTCVAARTIGSVSVFPSFVRHRVCPVKKGTRYSLVIWCNGKPFV